VIDTRPRRRGTALWLLAAVLLFATLAWGRSNKAQPQRSGALDGTKWSVTITPLAKGEKPVADKLVFDRGMFDSTACHQYGFGKAAYTAKREKGATSFTSTTRNAKEEIIRWQGKVMGQKISGTMTWRAKQGAAKNYKFAGAKA